jgi:hypothetical protein
MSSGMTPSASASGAASGSGFTNRNGPHTSALPGISDQSAGSNSGSRSERGALRSLPSSSYVQAW